MKFLNFQIVVTRRERISKGKYCLLIFTSILLTFILAGLLVIPLGVNPITFYSIFLIGSITTFVGISKTINFLIPILLCTLSAIISFKAGLWNIGQEGQYLIGAIAALGFTYFIIGNTISQPLSTILLIIIGGLAGGFWAFICGFLRAYTEANEAVTTLMMYYIALELLNYLCYGPWKNPKHYGFPITYEIPDVFKIPSIGYVTLAIIPTFVILTFTYFLIEKSRLGIEFSILSEGYKLASYSGLNIKKLICLNMFLSGFFAGIAGALYLAYTAHNLQPGFSAGYGFAGIVAAWLCELKIEYSILSSMLLAMIYASNYTMQIKLGLPVSTVQAIEGMLLTTILLVHFLTRYKIKIIRL